MEQSDTRRAESIQDCSPVLLFGELLVDIFPKDTVIGGAPFNVARHLRAFGLNPLLISRVGNDALGTHLIASLSGFRLNATGVQLDPINPTGRVLVHLEGGRHCFEILPDQAYDFIDAEKARQFALDKNLKLIYFGTLAQRGGVSRNALQTLLESVDAPRMVDLNLREPWFDQATLRATLEAADILKLNAEELGTLADWFRLPGKHPQAKAENLLSRFSVKKLLVTDGAAGAWLLNEDDTQAAIIGKPAETVVDTVGAGDAFAALCILGLLRGWPDSFVLERADEFARAICGIRGAVPMEEAFYGPFLEEWKV